MASSATIVMPKLGLTMTEGKLAEWRIKPGDSVKAGQILFVVETDKIANEIEAQAAGEVIDLLVPAGETVPVGAPVMRWTGPGTAAGPEATVPAPAQAPAPPSRPAAAAPAAAVQAAAAPVALAVGSPAAGSGGRILATPLARRLAREQGIDLGGIAGSGPRGRIKAADVATASTAARPRPTVAGAAAIGAPAGAAGLAGVVPDAIHAAMARRMVQSKRDVPHFYLASEAEVTALLDIRRQLNGLDGYPRVTLNHLVVAAVGVALREMPQANRIWLDGRIVAFDSTDVGIAISTPRGLFAPVLRDAGRIGIDRVATGADALAEAARNGRLGAQDMEGGAITVSNAGMFNVTRFAPIINPPQAAILGVGSVRELFRPDAEGRPSLKREMGLVLSCDHRILDGVAGLALLNRIIEILQAPLRLLRTGAD